MSLVNTVRGKKSNTPPQFWWEDGYDPSQIMTTQTTNSRIQYDDEGKSFELAKYTTDLNHMDAVFFHSNNTIVSLRHQRSRSASIALYSYTPLSGLVPQIIYDIGDNSGYMALSHDDKLLAVGILKEDLVMVFDVMNGELLVNVSGGLKLGYWGQLQFLPGNNNNTLVEVRTISMDKVGKPKETVIRTWDLGFKPETNSDSDEDDDEETVKVWEVKRRGNVCSTRQGNTMICAADTLQKLEWLDPSNGSILRQLSFTSWISKPVLSSNGLYVATAHFGYCLIHNTQTSELVGKITCPQNESNYPLIPIQFVNYDSYLVCRITQERALIISAWTCKEADSTVYLHQVGGTITDNTIRISSDEKYLICWPYGVIELYDMQAMINLLTKKLRRYRRFELVRMRHLVENNRATTISTVISDVNDIAVSLENIKISSKDEKKTLKSAMKGKKLPPSEPVPQQSPTTSSRAPDYQKDVQLFEILTRRLSRDLFVEVVLYL